MHSALIVGLVEDSSSLTALTDLLYDSTPLVAHAAAKGLLLVGKADPKVKGQVARALVSALEQSRRSDRTILLRSLIELSAQNLGEDPAAWKEWAQRLP